MVSISHVINLNKWKRIMGMKHRETYTLCHSAGILEKHCRILLPGTFRDLLRLQHKTGCRRGGSPLKSVQRPWYLKHDLGTLEPQPCLL